MNKDIYILGVGRNTIVYIDLVELCGYNVVGLYHFEKGRENELYFGHKIIGYNDKLFTSDLSGKQFAISVGDNNIRASLFERIKKTGGELPTIVHPSAIVSKYSSLGEGVMIHANSVISPDVTIGDNSVISSNDMIAHGSRIGKHCFIASNVVLGAYVEMKDAAFIGSGATIVSGKVPYIETKAIIGAGSVVVKSISPGSIVFGNPATTRKDK